MSVGPKHIPFDEFIADAGAIFDEVAAGKQVVVQRDGQLVRLAPAHRRAKRRARHLTPDDPLWDLAGAGSSGESGNHVSREIHRYIADAIAAHSTTGKRRTGASDDSTRPGSEPTPADPS